MVSDDIDDLEALLASRRLMPNRVSRDGRARNGRSVENRAGLDAVRARRLKNISLRKGGTRRASTVSLARTTIQQEDET